MIKLKNDLLTSKYTEVFHEKEFSYNAPHLFRIIRAGIAKEELGHDDLLAEVHFQEGAIKEFGVNGAMNEDLISMVICRLEHFQSSDFKCRENAVAITKLEEALMWLRKRTTARENRGIEGTHKV